MRIFLLILFFAFIFLGPNPNYEYKLPSLGGKSIELGSEDLQGRRAYQLLLTADPKTGQIPVNIRKNELEYAKQMEKRTENARTQQFDFESLGPVNVGGRTRAIAFDILDETHNTMLAGGVSGGVWKTTDGGRNWMKKSNPENRNSVTCIVQDKRPGKENIWYHGTGEIVGNSARGGQAPFRGNGIYKSVDNGETWQPITSTQDSDPNVFNSQFQYIWNIIINPDNLDQDELLVAAFGGILRSLDGGETWQVEVGKKLFNLSDTVNLNNVEASFFTSLERTSNGFYYAAFSTTTTGDGIAEDGGIYVSQDGDTWFDITPFGDESRWGRIVIGINENATTQPIFLIDAILQTGFPVGLVRLRLQGINDSIATAQFDDLTTNVPDFSGGLGPFETQGGYNMMVKIDPQNDNIIYLGGTNLYRTLDGLPQPGETFTSTWKWIGGYNPEGGTGVYPNHHPDQHNLLFYPDNTRQIISTNDGGIRISLDGTADSVNWQSLNSDYVTSQFYTIAQSKVSGSDIVIGGMQDNGTDIRNRGLSNLWGGIIGGDGAYVATTNDDLFWYASFQNGQTFRLSLDASQDIESFSRIDPAGLVAQAQSSFLFINPFILDPSNQNRVFMIGGNTIYLNDNIGQIPTGLQEPTDIGWVAVEGTFNPFENYSALDISSNGEILYAGTSAGSVIRVRDADLAVGHQTDTLGNLISGFGYVSCVAVNPEDENHVVVVYSNYNVQSVFESKDAGDSFINISGNLEENPDGSGNGSSVRWAEIIPFQDGIRIAVGTSTGLYMTESTEGENTLWVKQSTDLIGSSIITMIDYRPSDGSLVVASHGNGVFKTSIDDFKPIQEEVVSTESFEIINSFPNPFSESTRIQFEIPESDIVRIDVINSSGRLIRTLLFDNQFAGRNSITFDGKTLNGASLSNGIYFIRMVYRGAVKTTRVSLQR